MKKSVIIILVVVVICAASMVVLYAINSSSDRNGVPENISSNGQDTLSKEDLSAANDQNNAASRQPPMVADAAMYRGTVTEIQKEETGTVVTLKQARGTDFGEPQMKFRFTESTRADFTPEKGQYLEVYYGGGPNVQLDQNQIYDVITAVKYLSEDMVVYNGIVKEIALPDAENKNGWISFVNIDGKDPDSIERVFNIGDETQIYLNLKEVKAGDKLNIFTNGISTRSIPPQSPALEIRKYYEAL